MVAVPAGLIAERRVIMRLMRANAVVAAGAQPLNGLNWMQRRRLKRLVANGVIRETSPGYYYVSAPDLANRLAARRHRVAVAIALILVLFALSEYFIAR